MTRRRVFLGAVVAVGLALAPTRARAADDGRSLALSGYVHVDAVAFRQSSESQLDPSTGAPLNESRFLLRRARLRAESDQGYLHGALELDANTIAGPQVRPFAAEATFKWPASEPYRGPAELARATFDRSTFAVSAGLLMTPFGYEVPERENVRPFLERSTFANELVPQSYDLGVRIMGGFGHVSYAFAVVNGSPIGNRTFPGQDPDTSKDLVFRVGGTGSFFGALRLSAGVSGLTGRGFHAGSPPTKDAVQWRDENGDGIVDVPELRVLPGAPGSPSEGFRRFALGADVNATLTLPGLGDLTARGELVRAKNLGRGTLVADPVAAGRDLRELGAAVSLTQEITPLGLVGVRFDTYDPDTDADEALPFVRVPRDTSLSTWAFLALIRWKKARFVVEYDHRKNPFGRSPAGTSTTLPDDSLTFRAVVGF
ncbi:MAG: hypothetical protein U0183_35420 [Polyangiaceae bacterium]